MLIYLINDESAQGLVEYSLIISLIAIAVIAGVIAFGGALTILYEKIKSDVIDAL